MLYQHRRGLSFYRARYLRSNMTVVEKMMWIELRKKRFHAYRFRRQVPIGAYIADFCCIKLKLIIELDGPSHEDQKMYDVQRTNWLQTKGYHVLRFKNEAVLQGNEQIYESIHAVCIQLSN